MPKWILPTLCGVVAFTLSANANTIPTLALTEESSTRLSWSWGSGGPSGFIDTSTPNSWPATYIPIPASLDLSSVSGFEEAPGTFNYATADENGTFNLLGAAIFWGPLSGQTPGFKLGGVLSEFPTLPVGYTVVPDNTLAVSSHNLFAFTFHDAGDAVAIPDAGSSLLLLSIVLGAVGLLARCSPRLENT